MPQQQVPELMRSVLTALVTVEDQALWRFSRVVGILKRMAYESSVFRFRKTSRDDPSGKQIKHDAEIVFAGIRSDSRDIAEPSHIRSWLGKSPGEYVPTIARPIG